MRLQGPDPIVVRASKRMRNDGTLITQYGGTVLRLELDSVPLWRGDRVGLKQLADYFAEYLYLPRLRDSSVLLGAIAQGLGMLPGKPRALAMPSATMRQPPDIRDLSTAMRAPWRWTSMVCW